MFPRPWQFILFLKMANDTEWLLTGSVTQLVLAIISKDTRIPLERWVFDIFLVDPAPEGSEVRYDSFVCTIAGFALK